jgi:hypothetical protein
MTFCLRAAVGLAVIMVCVPAMGQKLARPKVELRWVEWQKIDGLTEETGFQSSCDPDSIVFPHKQPVVVLTMAEVSEARLTHHDFKGSGIGDLYMVALHLTPEAKAKLAADCKEGQYRLLTVVVDGKCWGLRRYEKSKEPGVPMQARAENFLPEVGFFSSMVEAQRLVDAFK